MNPLLRTALFFTALLTGSTSASAQCGEWQNLGPLYACGYAGLPNSFAADAASDELYGGTRGFCGYHGGTAPAVNRWSATGWSGDLNGFDDGIGYGLAFLDDGTGAALYQWGTGRFGADPVQPFLKRVPGGWVAVPNPVGIPTAVTAFDDGSGPRFYFAGVNGAIARFDNGVPQSLGVAIPQESVTELVVHDDGSGPALYAVGSFTSIGGVAANRVARWDGSTWNALGQGVGPEGGTYYRALRAISIPHGPLRGLYVGGSFAQAGGVPANGVARWEGGVWQGIGTGIGATVQDVGGFAWFDEGRGNGPRLVASGNLSDYSGFLRTWDGTQWSSIPSPIEPWGGPVVVFDRPQTPGIDLFAIGREYPYPQYPTYDQPATYSLEACDSTGELYCFGDGSVTACPCGNDSAQGERAGCQHSLGYGGAVRAHGTPSLSGDTLVIAGSAMTNSSVLYFQGMNSHAPIPFGDGLKCTSGPFVRFATKTNIGGASQYPAAGDQPVSVRGHVNAPGTRHYQARYRNSAAFCTEATFNYTNAVEILWAP